jgi:hypothetical protein
MFSVTKVLAAVGRTDADCTVCPFFFCSFTCNRYALRFVPGDGWTVSDTWTICCWLGASTPLDGYTIAA